jgi:DNA polymerase-1
MELIVDIETDKLDAQTIWIAATKDVQTDEIRTFTVPVDFNSYIRNYDTLIGHNFLSFDAPVLNRLWGSNISVKRVCDTLVLSTLFNPIRTGGHSLKNLALLAGTQKSEFSDFSKYTDEMLKYCINDVEVTHAVYRYLNAYEGSGFSEKSILLEHNIRHVINKQQNHGFLLDVPMAMGLLSKIRTINDDTEKQIYAYFKPKVRRVRDVIIKRKKNGCISKVGLNHIDNISQLGGDHTTIRYEEFNLGSPKQIVERMNEYGWKPVEFTPKGAAKVSDVNLATLPSTAPDVVKKLVHWKTLETRISTIDSWLDASELDSRIHGRVRTMGAVTGRMTHSNPNMANIVSVRKEYGKESRMCFTSPSDYVLVDTDASGLELRMLAHYMKNSEFTDEVVSGDPHTANMKAAGLSSRDEAKTFIYAFMYGAGVEKIGSIVGGGAKRGRALKKTFLANMPDLKKLQKKVVDRADTLGYINGLDGRRLFIRYSHAALNTLLQGAGAIVCKKWAILIDTHIRREKLDAHLVCSIHDQYVYEVHTDDVEQFEAVCHKSISEAGELLKVRCPLTCEVGVGKTWLDANH